jgi:hypothetical protein
MGTRGLWGFVIDGQEKLAYNHSDSYPDGLGARLVKTVKNRLRRKVGLKGFKVEARSLQMIDGKTPPSSEEQNRLSSFADLSVSTQSLGDWYCLLRHTQGDLNLTLNAGVMVDGRNFAQDSLFCEWGYVIDLDKKKFEVYRGFQESAHTAGRFHSRPRYEDGKYYPIALVASFPLNRIPKDWYRAKGICPDEDE